jgi:hypothetical protein
MTITRTSGGHRAEQVDLDHLALLGALVGGEQGQQHHAGVVDQHVGAAELVVDALDGGEDRSRSVTSAAMAIALIHRGM